ncbi:MAG: FAD-binding protein [Candidatus Lokiarchaeota archaeon]
MAVLNKYSSDLSYQKEKQPFVVTYPKNSNQIQKIIDLAKEHNLGMIPISSSGNEHYHGDTIPRRENCIILNLTRMNKILNIDHKNRVVMIEPGVTFGKLIPKLKKKGLRLLLPLHPRETKSVIASALEREPILIPRYHWDSSDPLLCLEVILWATIKCEVIPLEGIIYHYSSGALKDLLEFQYDLIKNRLSDEMFIINNLNLACLLCKKQDQIETLKKSLPYWNLIFRITGHGEFSQDRLDYLKGDISDLYSKYEKSIKPINSIINNRNLADSLDTSTEFDWRLRLSNNTKDFLFITNFQKITEQIQFIKENFKGQLGIYIQPINLGSSFHCEFNFYLSNQSDNFKDQYLELGKKLIQSGAFFSRPYGILSNIIFENQQEATIKALDKIKKIFDPKGIMNPGVLCYDKLITNRN